MPCGQVKNRTPLQTEAKSDLNRAPDDPSHHRPALLCSAATTHKRIL